MSRQTANLYLHRATRGLTALAAVLGFTLIAAAPASARDAFGDGFEHEMGRIVAHATVGAGLGLLYAVTTPVVVHHAPPRAVVHQRVHYRPHPKWKAKHKRGHGHGRLARHDRHAHRRGIPCDERRGRFDDRRGPRGRH